MKRLFLFLGIFLITNVNALEKCTTEKIQNLKQKASYVDFDYVHYTKMQDDLDYDAPIEVTLFKINILNHDENLQYGYKINGNEKRLAEGKTLIDNLSGGVSVTINIYAYTPDECCERLLRSQIVRIPIQNLQAKREECKDYPDFEYCQEYIDSNKQITDKRFESELEEYKNKLENSSKIEEIVEEEKTYNYKIIAIISVSIIVLLIVTIIFLKKHRKRDDFL